MLEQGGLCRWDFFKLSASSGKKAVPGLVDACRTTAFAVHDNNEALDYCHMLRVEAEEARIFRERH